MPGEPAIEATGLTKSYGSVRVLTGVDLHVPRGSVFSLLGPNGAGKTTTVRILTTLTSPDSGSARVAGHDLVRDRARVRRSISLTGQDTALDELLSGAENLRMMGRLCRLSRGKAAARADELLAQFDLVEAGSRRVGTYSGGMRRRLDLAASLIVPPAVMFLDEPTTGLDPRSRAAMWTVITELTRSGVTIFLTTQYLEEADRLADRIALVDGGRIVAEGTAAQLKQQVSGHRLDLTLTGVAAFDGLAAFLGDRALLPDRDRLTLSVATDGSAGHVRALLDELDPARTAVARFAVHTATLDDVFLALTGHTTTAKEPAVV
ncbi:ATP-binding cassette domain-containing protein [Actinophytocola algeriensis]|uniref:ABC-2 type transport system ATP-binding protein n=1 Tax=Actinophytocola algeriensis TaxID=1768010 RepID=A0A7W7Q083_9PSEU|nr:ATP-binding cassette domain-containing protein [Actinophytocola algeriensis]MBB4904463.1 ABC-2 type transport system ATP-binding protein [Actinophytocola algeriensis]MBE1476678.1 ABC-2 type transport system ATP-binding protein [Actinophytocola algeriensis]